MVKLLYIAGDGRSGSTLLNIALGNHDEVVAMGELCNVHRYVLGQQNWCSCGVPVNACEFWTSFKRHLSQSDRQPLLKLQARFESSRATLTWPWLAATNSARIRQYQSNLLEVLHAVSNVSGCSLIVDASKLPGRAMALAMMPDVELYLVHLVRDARAVVCARSKSWKRDLSQGIEADVPARSTARVCINWCKANLLTSLVRGQLHPSRSIRVRYEDFATDPGTALGRIGDMLQMDFSAVATTLQSGQSLCNGHTGSGNRMRMGDVTLKPDFEWIDRLSSRSQAMTWALTGQLLRRYGYQRTVSTEATVPYRAA